MPGTSERGCAGTESGGTCGRCRTAAMAAAYVMTFGRRPSATIWSRHCTAWSGPPASANAWIRMVYEASVSGTPSLRARLAIRGTSWYMPPLRADNMARE